MDQGGWEKEGGKELEKERSVYQMSPTIFKQRYIEKYKSLILQ